MLTSLIVVAIALVISAAAFPTADGSLSPVDGVFTALVLMTGGTYADLFPPFGKLSNWLRLLSVTLSAIGTVFVGLLYAFFTERVMTLRFRLGTRRPAVPRKDHVVVVGLGRVGRHAAERLQELQQPVAAIEAARVGEHALPDLPGGDRQRRRGDTLGGGEHRRRPRGTGGDARRVAEPGGRSSGPATSTPTASW